MIIDCCIKHNYHTSIMIFFWKLKILEHFIGYLMWHHSAKLSKAVLIDWQLQNFLKLDLGHFLTITCKLRKCFENHSMNASGKQRYFHKLIIICTCCFRNTLGFELWCFMLLACFIKCVNASWNICKCGVLQFISSCIFKSDI